MVEESTLGSMRAAMEVVQAAIQEVASCDKYKYLNPFAKITEGKSRCG